MAVNVAALVVVALLTFFWASSIARREALHDAKATGQAFTTGLIIPQLTRAALAGDPSALRKLDSAVRGRMGDGSMRQVIVWDARGRIIYSDKARLVGQRFPIEDHRNLLDGKGVTASVSSRRRTENIFERAPARLIEVEVGFRGPDGRPMLVEANLSGAGIAAKTASLRRELWPLTIVSLLLMQVVLLPLAVAMTRRVARAERDRRRMLQSALSASDLERRRVAHDLHDGVIQDLAGLGYALSAVEKGLLDDPRFVGVRGSAGDASAIVRRDVAALRGLLTEIYPPDLGEGQLIPVLQVLVEGLAGGGVTARLRADEEPELPSETALLVYRLVREGLRNVAKHAEATNATVTLRRERRIVRVEIVDDGRGLPDAGAPPGHLGLQLISDAVRDTGGTFDVVSAPGRGTRLTALIPVR